MEIRRCDKCKTELDPAIVKDMMWWGENPKAIRLEVPFIKTQRAPKSDELDDKDEFDNNSTFPKRKIDLCEVCIMSFGALMGTWFE